MNNFNFKSYDTIKQTISYCEVDKCPAVIKLREQLEAKAQECEELKLDLIEAKAHGDYLNNLALSKTLDTVSAELDQFKAENDKYSLFIEKLCDYAGLECDSEEQAMRTLSDLASQMNKARWIIDRYKQTLTEIKEIAKEQIPYLNIDKAKTMIEIEYDYAGKIYNLEQRMYKILQKIDECGVK